MWIRPFNNHKIVKDKLLKAINNIPKSPINQSIDNKISHTDFYLPGDVRREYLDIFYDSIRQHMITLCNDFILKVGKFFLHGFNNIIKEMLTGGTIMGNHNLQEFII